MWTRSDVKTRAKQTLQSTYWTALIISVILYITGTSYFGPGSDMNIKNNSLNDNTQIYRIGNMDINAADYDVTIQIPTLNPNNEHTLIINPFHTIHRIWGMPLVDTIFLWIGHLLIISAILCISIRFFIGYHVQVSGYKYFIYTAQNQRGHFNDWRSVWRGKNYWNVLITMFIRDVYTFLWTLLFVIPGIIKRYSYAFVPYILAENPEMEPHVAIRMSMDMTRGHKWDMFILNLSFLGWYLLGSMLLGIGVIFVWPYENATFAQLYLILSKGDRARE